MGKRKSSSTQSVRKSARIGEDTSTTGPGDRVSSVDIPVQPSESESSNAVVLSALEGINKNLEALAQRQTVLEKRLDLPGARPNTVDTEGVVLGGGHSNGNTSSSRDTTAGTGGVPECRNAPAGEQTQRVPLSSIRNVELLPKPIKDAILEFKDVNLAVLLLSLDYLEARAYQSGKPEKAEKVYLKLLSDARVARPLSLTEFVKAFSVYKRVMLRAHPHRQEELDTYERDIIHMATLFPTGQDNHYGFYDYHKRFSAKAAAAWANLKLHVDWSVREHSIFSEVFMGYRANRCKFCQSTVHASESCVMSIRQNQKGTSLVHPNANPGNQYASNNQFTDRRGRQKVFHNGLELCNNYNLGTCVVRPCRFLHVCLRCFGSHPQKACNNNGGVSTGDPNPPPQQESLKQQRQAPARQPPAQGQGQQKQY